MTLKVAVAKVIMPVRPVVVEPVTRILLGKYVVLQRDPVSVASHAIGAKRALSNARSATQPPSAIPEPILAFRATVTVPPGRTDGDDASARMMT